MQREEEQASFNFATWCLSLICLNRRIALDSCSWIQIQFAFHQNANKVLFSSISSEDLTIKFFSSHVCKTLCDAIYLKDSLQKGISSFYFMFSRKAGLLWRLILHSFCSFKTSSISECSSREEHSWDAGSVSAL